MRVKTFLLSAFAIMILALFFLFMIPRETKDLYLDIRTVNNIVKTLSDGWDLFLGGGGILPFQDEIDYVVVTNSGERVAATRDGLNEHLNDAIRNRDTIVDIVSDGSPVGKIIFYNESADIIKQNRAKLYYTAIIILAILMLIFVGYAFYLYSTLLRPFKKMQNFARHIAGGNLDIPLEMNRSNLFGAFTESFDMMREELHKAREKEREADRSKKELVASLSHDIKTPIASIKSATELMLYTIENEEYREQLEGITVKAEQIDSLITNMFHATLEELKELTVSIAEIPSTEMQQLIRYADYDKRVKPFVLPNCLISADSLRLGQIFDNIISNSYKYAGTEIEIRAFFEESYLVIDVADFGPGVPEEELPLILHKFYRGKDAIAKSGYGLGLYIAKYLLEQMQGDIRCENRPDGFCVRVMVRLA